MTIFTKQLWIMATSLLLASCTSSQNESLSNTKHDEKSKKAIEQVVESYVSNHAFEGTILVSKSQNIVFERAYGFSDREKNQTTNTEHSFLLASLSKPLTATLILMLEQQGKLSLDDSLANYFPQFTGPLKQKITLHHLLSHTSGIPNHFGIDGWFEPEFHQATSDLDFITVISKLPISSAPGKDYLYSNPAYFLLGQIVEKVTAQSFSTNLDNHILSPLSMRRSGVATGVGLDSGIVKGYQWRKDGGYREQVAKNMDLFGAGAAIYSNIHDLYQFDLALYGNKLVNKNNKQRLFDPENAYSWRVGNVAIGKEKNVNVHMYDGQFDGFSTFMTRFVDDKHSIIILRNVSMSYFVTQQMTMDIAAILYDQEAPNRSNDVSLALINGIVTGLFDETLNNILVNKESWLFSEASLSALAYQVLWSGLGENSLKLFSLISTSFPDSSSAKQNLKQACSHRLTLSASNREYICN